MQTIEAPPPKEEAKLTPLEASRFLREKLQEMRLKQRAEWDESIRQAVEVLGMTPAEAKAAVEPEDYRLRNLLRYPRLCAHLICKSLGYLTPKCAGFWIQRFKANEVFWCEWHDHMAQWDENGVRCKPQDRTDYEDRMRRVSRNAFRQAIKERHSHHGSMADYWQGRIVCYRELAGKGPVFMSW
jgi:hypothetical protein